MPSINKPILRLALAIHAWLASKQTNEPLIELPNDTWSRCTELARQIRRAQLRGWHLAARELHSDLSYSLISLSDQLAVIRERLPRSQVVEPSVSANALYRDLLALNETFGEMDFDLAAKRLSVTTDPISLEGVYLGPFEIQLQWSRSSREVLRPTVSSLKIRTQRKAGTTSRTRTCAMRCFVKEMGIIRFARL